jgi:hypothetical protein
MWSQRGHYPSVQASNLNSQEAHISSKLLQIDTKTVGTESVVLLLDLSMVLLR